MAQQAGPHEVWIALSGLFPGTVEPLRAAFDGLIPQDRIMVWDAPSPVLEIEPNNGWRHKAAELLRESFLASLSPDVVHVASLFEGWVDNAVASIALYAKGIPTAVTLYDLIPLIHEDTYLEDERQRAWYLRKLSSLQRSHVTLAISEHSRREGIQLLGLPEASTVNVSTAADPSFHPVDLGGNADLLRSRYGLTRPFVMYAPGAFDEHKNVEGLIQGYARLPHSIRDSHCLAIVSKIEAEMRDQLDARARAAGLGPGELVLTGYVPDADLVGLYCLCDLFVCPSLHEGFGLPALEAMSCGAAVVGANTTSLPEVIGWSDALFEPRRLEDMASRMNQALTDSDFHAALCRNSLTQAKRFSWDLTAQRALEAFERVHRENERPHQADFVNSTDRWHELAEAVTNLDTAISPGDTDWTQLAAAMAENHPAEGHPRQLLVDVSVLARGDAKSGIQRVVRAVLRELLAHPPHDFRVEPVHCDVEGTYRYGRRLGAEIIGGLPAAMDDDPIETRAEDVFLGLDLSGEIISSHMYFFERLRDRGIPMYFVIYDLLPLLRPDAFPPGSDWYARWLDAVARVGDGVVCISRAVANEFLGWINEAQIERHRVLRVGHFHLGADISASVPTGGLPPDSERILTTIAARPFLLMVGTLEPRKGHAQTLAALEQLWSEKTDVGLVVVGGEGWMVKPLAKRLRRHPEHGRRLIWLQGVSDEMLLRLYESAAALLAASEGEGFGLPLVEAAQHGLPIIARDLPVFREVAGEHAYYFSGTAPEDLAAAVSSWLELNRRGEAPTSKDMPWLTWAQSTGQLLDVIQNDHWYARWPDSCGRPPLAAGTR
jgi:glycosyltransferase involved in cell wall biosynthesis